MRKQTKLAVVFSAAALLAIGASMTSLAATGWSEENGTWVYYDRNGEKVMNNWAKSGDQWYFLGDNGEMQVDKLIEDNGNYYYVDDKGVQAANTWVALDNSNDDAENAAPVVWYYFQNNGKAYKAPESGKTSFKTINGKSYAFDAEARMLYGWVDDTSTKLNGDDEWGTALYYLGGYDDGARVNGAWSHVTVVDTTADDPDQTYWFYFGANGKKHASSGDGDVKESTINGKKYGFDHRGKMVSEWVHSATFEAAGTASDSARIAQYKYFSSPEDGARKTKGWFYVVPSGDVNASAHEDGSQKWYYADGNGKLYRSALKTISGKKYLFNDKGEMLSGLLYADLTTDNGLVKYAKIDDAGAVDKISSPDPANRVLNINSVPTTIATSTVNGADGVYYFGSGDDGSMKTGNQNISLDGESYAFRFNTAAYKGLGENGASKKNGLFVNGLRLKADTDARFAVYEVTALNGVVIGKVDNTLSLRVAGTTANGKRNGSAEALAPAYAGRKFVVIGTSGAVQIGSKKDGNDVTLVSNQNGELVGAYTTN